MRDKTRQEVKIPPAVKRQIDSLCRDVKDLNIKVKRQEVKIQSMKSKHKSDKLELFIDIKLLTKLVRTLIEEAQRHVRKG